MHRASSGRGCSGRDNGSRTHREGIRDRNVMCRPRYGAGELLPAMHWLRAARRWSPRPLRAPRKRSRDQSGPDTTRTRLMHVCRWAIHISALTCRAPTYFFWLQISLYLSRRWFEHCCQRTCMLDCVLRRPPDSPSIWWQQVVANRSTLTGVVCYFRRCSYAAARHAITGGGRSRKALTLAHLDSENCGGIF